MSKTDLEYMLHTLIERGGSDLILTVGAAPHVKIDGVLHPFEDAPLTQERVAAPAAAAMTPAQQAEYESRHEMNLALESEAS